ncbi:MAG: hypothetical protein ABI727_02405 [Nitrosospira sp.]
MSQEVCHGSTKKICQGVQAGSGSVGSARQYEASQIAGDLDIDLNTGSLVPKNDVCRCMTYSTPYPVSEVIGAGGEASLAHLSVIWRLLYKHYTTGGTRLTVKSYLLSEAGFRSLQEGKIHPLTIFRESGQDLPWWEDFWDVSQYPQHDYWPGWKSVCGRIHRVVDLKDSLKEQDDLISS